MRAQRGPFTVVVNAAPVRRARRRARDAGDPPAPRADAAAARGRTARRALGSLCDGAVV